VKKSLAYIAICSKKKSPGIYKKILGFVNGAKKNSISSKSIIVEPRGVNGYLTYIREIALSNSNYVVIRYLPKLGFIIFLLGVLLKLSNRNLIIDVPTPMKSHIKEIMIHNRGFLSRFFNISLIYLQSFIPFLSASRVIQYADEARFFSFFIDKKTILIGNGVDVESIPLRKSTLEWPSKTLNLVAVGTVAIWHGWDKILTVIKELKDENFQDFNISFKVIGDGPEVLRLKKMSRQLNITENVEFLGFLDGERLYSHYSDSHIGVGSLGWGRVGVEVASPIKSREYLAAGLPVLYSTKDVDIHEDCKIAIYLQQSEDVCELKNIIKNLGQKSLSSPEKCRNFALNNLDFSTKVCKVLDGLN